MEGESGDASIIENALASLNEFFLKCCILFIIVPYVKILHPIYTLP
jgi:hypothetical protein